MNKYLVDDLKKYLGLPPYNNSCNIDMHDSYVINSIYLKYGKEEVDKAIKQLTTDEVD